MDSRELVHRCLRFEALPRVPYAVDFTIPARQELCAADSGRALYERLRNDLLVSPVIRVGWGSPVPSGFYRDEFGQLWDRRIDPDIGLPQALVTPDNLEIFPWPDPRAAGRFKALQRNLWEHPDRFHLMSLDFSLFERAWGLRGLETLYVDFVERSDFVEALLDKILAFNLQVVEAGLEACPEIDAVHFGDDFGDQAGIPIGAERWRRLLKPRLARQYAAVRGAGKKVSIHSCGKIDAILDDLVEIGVELCHPFQPEVMDVEVLLARYRGRLCFWGGIGTQQLLPRARPREVRRRVEELLALGRRGGYVISPAGAVPPGTPLVNVEAMLRPILEQGGSATRTPTP